MTILHDESDVKMSTGLSTVPNYECIVDSISCQVFKSIEFSVKYAAKFIAVFPYVFEVSGN